MSENTLSQHNISVYTAKRNQVLIALFSGIIILSIVSLAPVEIIHNATHDTRHSTGFPCH